MEQAQQAGIESVVEPRTDAAAAAGRDRRRRDRPGARATLYVLAFTIVRADEHVSGAERIYLAQLATYSASIPLR